MDKSSLNILEKIVYDAYNNDYSVKALVESSYEKFMSHIKLNSLKMSIQEIYNFIPDTEITLQPKNVGETVSLINFNLTEKDSQNITVESIYWICRSILDEYKCNKVTGASIANIRDFKDFDATHTIGDVHSTIVFELQKGHNLSSFGKQITNMISLIQEGIILGDNIYNDYPVFEKLGEETLNKRANVNITFNYLGEVKDVEIAISEITNASYAPHYFIGFSRGKSMYVLNSGNYLLKEKYLFDYGDGQKEISITKLSLY